METSANNILRIEFYELVVWRHDRTAIWSTVICGDQRHARGENGVIFRRVEVCVVYGIFTILCDGSVFVTSGM